MKNKEIINFKALSKRLTGSENTIKGSNTATKYINALNNLDQFIDLWISITIKELEPKKKNNNMLRKNNFNR
jgi:hypothetical protein